MCMLLPNFATYAGGIDKTIWHGDYKKTVYASHETLKKLLDAEKKEKKSQKAFGSNVVEYVGHINEFLGVTLGFMKAGIAGIESLFGDSTFLSDCLEKSKNNGKRGCIMKYTLIVHDETPDEWWPDSCELQ